VAGATVRFLYSGDLQRDGEVSLALLVASRAADVLNTDCGLKPDQWPANTDTTDVLGRTGHEANVKHRGGESVRPAPNTKLPALRGGKL
jgi:hypothetical protein